MDTIQSFGPDIMTGPEAQKALRLSRWALRKLLSTHVPPGPIEARYLNGRLRICQRSLQQYLDNLTEDRDT